jgi:hypothetical protein
MTNAGRPRLLDDVRDRIRVRHYSPRTERAYVAWIRRFILFHDKGFPREMGAQSAGSGAAGENVMEFVGVRRQPNPLPCPSPGGRGESRCLPRSRDQRDPDHSTCSHTLRVSRIGASPRKSANLSIASRPLRIGSASEAFHSDP